MSWALCTTSQHSRQDSGTDGLLTRYEYNVPGVQVPLYLSQVHGL